MRSRRAPEPTRAAELAALLGLTGFAISQPLLEVLGDEPTVFASAGIGGGTIVWFALAVAVLPPMVLWLLGLVARAIHRVVGRAVHLAMVLGLAALAAIQGLEALGLTAPTALAVLAGVVAIATAASYARSRTFAAWVRATAFLPFLAVVLFVFASSAGELRSGSGAAVPREVARDLPPVVFVMLDEFPTKSILDASGGIDAARFPSLAALAGDATWYRRYSTLAPLTEMAVPSVLSGREPTLDDPIAANHPDTLFSLLAPTHELQVFEAGTALCGLPACNAPRLGDLVERTVEVWLERVSPAREAPEEVRLGQYAEQLVAVGGPGAEPSSNLRVRVRPTRADAFLAVLGPSERPTLSFLHLLLPHVPWTLFEDGTTYTARVGDRADYPFGRNNDVDWLAALAEQRHLLQAEYTDRLVGQVLERLRDTGVYDETLLVVTADHGASFERGTNLRILTPGTYDSIAYAPLLVKAPGQRSGRVDDSNLMSADVLPTLAELLDLEVGWALDGAPAGSAEVASRGDEKHIHDVASIFVPTPRGIRRFDGVRHFPRAADRWIATIARGEDRLAGLHALLPLDGVLGRRLDELRPRRGGEVEVIELDRLERTAGQRVGVVTGRVPDAPAGATLVVAVDGTVVSGSPLYEFDGEPGRFAALLPARVVRADRREIRIALVVPDGVVTELDVVAA